MKLETINYPTTMQRSRPKLCFECGLEQKAQATIVVLIGAHHFYLCDWHMAELFELCYAWLEEDK